VFQIAFAQPHEGRQFRDKRVIFKRHSGPRVKKWAESWDRSGRLAAFINPDQ
jgi:hypothetical protein